MEQLQLSQSLQWDITWKTQFSFLPVNWCTGNNSFGFQKATLCKLSTKPEVVLSLSCFKSLVISGTQSKVGEKEAWGNQMMKRHALMWLLAALSGTPSVSPHGWAVRCGCSGLSLGQVKRGGCTPRVLRLGKCDFASAFHHPYGAHTPTATKNYRSGGLVFFLSRALLPPPPHLDLTYDFCYLIHQVHLRPPNHLMFVNVSREIIWYW